MSRAACTFDVEYVPCVVRETGECARGDSRGGQDDGRSNHQNARKGGMKNFLSPFQRPEISLAVRSALLLFVDEGWAAVSKGD